MSNLESLILLQPTTTSAIIAKQCLHNPGLPKNSNLNSQFRLKYEFLPYFLAENSPARSCRWRKIVDN